MNFIIGFGAGLMVLAVYLSITLLIGKLFKNASWISAEYRTSLLKSGLVIEGMMLLFLIFAFVVYAIIMIIYDVGIIVLSLLGH